MTVKLIMMKKINKNELIVPGGATKVLLHTCCAPCSSAIIECMLQHNIRPTIFYCNPNIYPKAEYEIRKNECVRYAKSLGLDVVEAAYDHGAWLHSVHGFETCSERGGRCEICFRQRLRCAAQYAHDHHFSVITTTLASSRWKSLDQINEAGNYAVAPFADVLWWPHNWRKGGLSERRLAIIKEYNFYNQKYCGCEFSMRKNKILFLHGFTSSGSCEIARTLAEELARYATVMAPDLPLHPQEALNMIKQLCAHLKPDLIVGSSCGGMYAQQISSLLHIPSLLVNPYFKMSLFLKDRLGVGQYKSYRKDGIMTFNVTDQLVHEYQENEKCQFFNYKKENINLIWGMFGTNDTLANFKDLFEKYYANSYSFDGPHTMNNDNVKKDLIPIIHKMLDAN